MENISSILFLRIYVYTDFFLYIECIIIRAHIALFLNEKLIEKS